MKLTIALLLLLLSACRADVSEPVEAATPAIEAHIDGARLPTGVYEFHLADGTRCVGLYYHAVTCEWRQP